MRLIDEASLVIIGVGAVDAAGSLSSANALETDAALEELRAMGARAEVLGQFFDANGAILSTPFDGRVMAPDLETLRGREVVAIAGGPDKAPALDAALKGGIITGLITDEATARGLADMAAMLPISNMASG
jgi:DNA-binding transcriptional regulator LsrR (DeoR family)